MENGGNGAMNNSSCTAASINELMMMGYGGGAALMSSLSSSTTDSHFPPPNYLASDVLEFHQNHRPSSSSSGGGGGDGNGSASSAVIKAKIMAHPHYPRLLAAYVNCQKVGAPPEVVSRLEEACAEETEAVMMGRRRTPATGTAAATTTWYLGEDPALDQFMEAYCEMLTKYEQELTKPINEAMIFLSRIELQFKALTLYSSSSSSSSTALVAAAAEPAGEGALDRKNVSSEEDIDMNTNLIDPQTEERELKCQLLRKYSGYLGSLKQEFMKKRKKGKLPKEARHQLLDWWSRHYKWPYPSESQKLALAESTGLDPKQINNWFINQRKRHWKPSEDMQFLVMDAAQPHYGYMDNVLANPFPMPMDISSTLV